MMEQNERDNFKYSYRYLPASAGMRSQGFIMIFIAASNNMASHLQHIAARISSYIRLPKQQDRKITSVWAPALIRTPVAVSHYFIDSGSKAVEAKIIGRGIASLNYFRIFNRWGVCIFSP